jgi:hypothetical protein
MEIKRQDRRLEVIKEYMAGWTLQGQLSGPPGSSAFTTTASNFTCPPIGSTVVVTVADASWMVVGQYLWIESAGGGTGLPGQMQVQAISGKNVTLLNVSVSTGLPDAPSDANTYGRHAGAWVGVLPEAPTDGRPYVRQSAAWSVAPTATTNIWGETPFGPIDGTNLSYSSAHPYTSGKLAVYLNGLRLRPSSDYIETGSQSFQFLSAPLPGDSLSIDYVQSSTVVRVIVQGEKERLQSTFPPPPSSLEPGSAYGLFPGSSRQAPPFYSRRSLGRRSRR